MNSKVMHAKAGQIKKAIKGNAGGVMGTITLSNVQVKAIAKVLSRKGGKRLFPDPACAACHNGGGDGGDDSGDD